VTLDATEVLVGTNGNIHTGPLTSDAPADEAAILDTDFHELGYVSGDGATFTLTREFVEIDAWQSFESVRSIPSTRATQLAFGLRQWNEDTLPLAMGGGVVAAGNFEPADPEDTDERSLVLDWVDGAKNYRLYVPRGLVTSPAEFNLRRTDNALLPIVFGVRANPDLAKIGGKPFKLFTDDPALGAV
jgi:hypothetical protein